MTMTMRSAVLLAAVVLTPLTGRAAYPGARDPDWPCQQIKVPHLSYGTMWTGPALDPLMQTWSKDSEVAGLVHDLAERRIPIEQAQAEIATFAQHAGPQKQQRLSMLMAGLFDTLDRERASVIDGLDRFGRSQRTFRRRDSRRQHPAPDHARRLPPIRLPPIRGSSQSRSISSTWNCGCSRPADRRSATPATCRPRSSSACSRSPRPSSRRCSNDSRSREV